MRAATCFSGIGAPEIAMPGWDWIWHAEIEPFPSAVMAHHHPGSVNLGDVLGADFLDRAKAMGPIDVMAGGPPCQGFSVAGLRGGMSDPRGNLTLRWVQILHAIQPRNAVTENVPGWLSMPDNAFGCFLGGLVGADDALCSPLDGGKWPSVGMVAGPRARAAWRILDAQYFGVAQRRRRVFVVADFGEGADPAEILFERQGVLGNPSPSREKGQGFTADVAPSLVSSDRGVERTGETRGQDPLVAVGFGGGNCSGPIDIAPALNANERYDFDSEAMIAHGIAPPITSNPYGDHEAREGLLVAHSLRAEGFDASEDGTGRGTPIVPVQQPIVIMERGREGGSNLEYRQDGTANAILTPNGGRGGMSVGAIAFPERLSGTQYASTENLSPSLAALNPTAVAIQAGALRENPSSGSDGVGGVQEGLPYTLEARAEVQAVAFDTTQITSKSNYSNPQPGDPCHPLAAGTHPPALADAWAVRRLTPVECARLQGFPDDFLDITYRGKPAADGNKYKALGNSWAVPVGRWILERVEESTLNREIDDA